MAKIPSVQDFGGTPTPAASRPMPNIPATGRGVQEGANIMSADANRAGSGTTALARGLETAGGIISKAEDDIRSGQEAVSRVRDIGAYSEAAAAELRRLQTEGDLSSLEVTRGYGKFLKDQQADVLQNHAGSPESRLRLEQRLEQVRFQMAGQAGELGTAAQRKLIDDAFGKNLNGLVARVEQDPSQIPQLFQSLDGIIEDMAPAATPEMERAWRSVGRETIVLTAMENLIDRGAWRAVQEILDDAPGMDEILSPAARQKVRDKIALTRQEQRKAAAPVKLGQGEILVDPVTGQKIASGEAKTEKLVEIFDETSPTKSRLVPESQASGLPGRERQPVVSITQQGETEMAKQLGKLDAERVVKAEDDAQLAYRTLAEVDRMSAAIESGRFTTGVFSDARVFLSRLADFVGASDDVKKIVGDAATSDTLDAAASRLGIEAAQNLSRLTNMSLTFIKDSLPSLARTPEGNRVLLEVMKRTAGRQIQHASLMDQYIQRHGTLRPENEKTYFQAVRDLEEEDPVITPELRKRIVDGSKDAPKSFTEIIKDVGKSQTLSKQEEVDKLEPGTEFIWGPTGQKLRKQ